MEFIKKVLEFKQPPGRVLDLGAGKGDQSQQFTEVGFEVTAVDLKNSELNNPKIKWVQSGAADFLKEVSEKYDIIYARNILQFLDKQYVKEELVNKFKEILNQGGVIDIHTFYKEPEPPFPMMFRSLYEVAELKDIFKEFEVLYEVKWDGMRPDLQGQTRHFYGIEIILKKKS